VLACWCQRAIAAGDRGAGRQRAALIGVTARGSPVSVQV